MRIHIYYYFPVSLTTSIKFISLKKLLIKYENANTST